MAKVRSAAGFTIHVATLMTILALYDRFVISVVADDRHPRSSRIR
jgi:hypothetical protein